MKKKATRKAITKSKANKSEPRPSTWVDRVVDDWQDVVVPTSSSLFVDPEEAACSSSTLSVGIVCWNVLADSYCSRRSHQNLPLVYQNHVFDRKQRQNNIRQILKRFGTGTLAPDIIALQEVDAPLDIPTCMDECGYQGHHTPTDITGRIGRVDACAVYFRRDRWNSIEVEMIHLDDLATLCTPPTNHPPHQDNNIVSPTRATTTSSLIRIESSFQRKNMALLVRLKHLETGQDIVVAVAHLFWNPLYQDVKLCQAHYVATRAHAFAQGSPVILAGDTNSQPGGAVHQYLTQGTVNARAIAPWYDKHPFQFPHGDSLEEDTADRDQGVPLEGIEPLLEEEEEDSTTSSSPRYLLDYTLNRLCRWLRILGIDAALETEQEERMRTKDGNIHIFERCRNERRTLVTSSTRLVMRKDCPPGTYRLDTQALSNLELSLVHLLLSHGVEIQPQNFLSICVVCNGSIDRVEDEATIEGIFVAHKAPDNLIDQQLKVWQCSGCKQGYWYDERPTSSASRVKNQATKLLKLCIRGGVPVVGDLDLFDFIDIESVRKEPVTDVDDEALCRLKEQRLDILEWLQDEELQNPVGPMRSVYGDQDGKEQLHFTNVTAAFVGHLDYILYDSRFRVIKQLYVPTTFDELQDGTNVRNGHLLPSNVWPSDHLAIGAVLTLSCPGGRTESTSKKSHLPVLAHRLSASPSELEPDVSGVGSSTRSPLMDTALFCLPLGTVPNQFVGPSAMQRERSPTHATSVVASRLSALALNRPTDAPKERPPPHKAATTSPPPLYTMTGNDVSLLDPGDAESNTLPRLETTPEAHETSVISTNEPHVDRCSCGCVPNVMSLLEMAEARKKARDARKAAAATS